MKKIKRFKINIRPSYLLRLIKKSVDIEKDEINTIIRENYELVDPCTIYDNFKLEDMKDGDLERTIKGWAPGAVVNPYSVVSFAIVTVGGMLDEKMSKLKGEGSERVLKILDALGSEALEQSCDFVTKLMAKDAEKEECAVGVLEEVPEDNREAILELLEARKIDVSLDGNSDLVPRKSLVVYGYWVPVKKKKRK